MGYILQDCIQCRVGIFFPSKWKTAKFESQRLLQIHKHTWLKFKCCCWNADVNFCWRLPTVEGWFNLPGADRPFANGWHVESGNEQNIRQLMLFPAHIKMRKVFRPFDRLKIKQRKKSSQDFQYWMVSGKISLVQQIWQDQVGNDDFWHCCSLMFPN